MGTNHSKEEATTKLLSSNSQNGLSSIDVYQCLPLVSLEVAVKPLVACLPLIETFVRIVKTKCLNPEDDLTCDQSAAIMLCTLRWQPHDQCLSVVLNEAVRSPDRETLKPWFLYLKLLFTGLARLPSMQRRIYRGIRMDVREHYPKGKSIAWPQFTLCTSSLDTLRSEQCLGRKGPRTIITIDSHSSKDISRHSFFPCTDLILLMADTRLRVTQCLKQRHHLYWIQLEEIHSPWMHLQAALNAPLPQTRNLNFARRIPRLLSSARKSVSFNQNLAVIREHSPAQSLTQTISKQPANASIQLRLDSVTNDDMRLIVQHAIVGKQCSELWLYNAKINAQGALILSNTLHENTTLKKLYLNDNDIRDRGAYCLAQALAINNSTLEELYLARNGITSRGAQYLADMLSTNRTIITLSLYGNRIDDLGISYLIHGLTYKNTTLECLYLSGNTLMTDASVASWLDLFKHNRTLKKLHLFNCNLSERSKDRLRRAVRAKGSFTLYV